MLYNVPIEIIVILYRYVKYRFESVLFYFIDVSLRSHQSLLVVETGIRNDIKVMILYLRFFNLKDRCPFLAILY